MMLKMAVFAPMPNARVSTTTVVKPGFFSSWRIANLRSFITQRHDWIDLRGAPRRQPASQGCHTCKHQRNRYKGEWIVRSNLEEERADHPCQCEGAGQTNQNAESG